jgi:hypothetical protein
MNIGDPVLHRGRRYILRGLDPMSVPDRQAFLEDPETAEQATAPVDEIEAEAQGGGAGLREV